jgi:hypothetical protein
MYLDAPGQLTRVDRDAVQIPTVKIGSSMDPSFDGPVRSAIGLQRNDTVFVEVEKVAASVN